ncbi:MAG: META domain-containing protein [Chloroflexota bacterium]
MTPKKLHLLGWYLPLLVMLTACSFTGLLSGGQSDELRSMGDVTWVLKFYGTEGDLTPALPQPQITLNFDFDKEVASGIGGCNNYSASFTLRNANLSIEQAMSTLMACLDNQAMQQETDYLMLLSQVASYKIEGNALVLFTENGETLHFLPSN